MKVVINRCYGGFGLSKKAIQRYLELKGKECHFYKDDYKNKIYNKVDIDTETFLVTIFTKDYGDSFKQPEWIRGIGKEGQSKEYNDMMEDNYFSEYNVKRDDPELIKVIEELGSKANGDHAKLEVVEIPDDVKYNIDDYDGIESIHEEHRSW